MARWTVGELIEELQDCDPDFKLEIYDAVAEKSYGLTVDGESIEGYVRLVVTD